VYVAVHVIRGLPVVVPMERTATRSLATNELVTPPGLVHVDPPAGVVHCSVVSAPFFRSVNVMALVGAGVTWMRRSDAVPATAIRCCASASVVSAAEA
jgi:hypothetical protein